MKFKGFDGEIPLRGWKEICPLLGVQDKRTAKSILVEKKMLNYENGRPVLRMSVYLSTLDIKKR